MNNLSEPLFNPATYSHDALVRIGVIRFAEDPFWNYSVPLIIFRRMQAIVAAYGFVVFPSIVPATLSSLSEIDCENVANELEFAVKAVTDPLIKEHGTNISELARGCVGHHRGYVMAFELAGVQQ